MTLVADIRLYTRRPGAIQYNAKDRALWFACPCGCGRLDAISYAHLQENIKRDRLKPSCKYLVAVCADVDSDEVHWCGSLINGEFISDKDEETDAKEEARTEEAAQGTVPV